MAFPTIPTVAASRILTGVQTGTSSTRTFPSLSSLTKNSGDLLVAIVICYQSSLTSNIFSSWGASFTEFHDSGGTNEMCVGMAYKVSTGSETGTFSVTQGGTITGDAAFILLSIEGASGTVEAGSRAVGTSSAADPASFDPAGWGAEDTLWISVAGNGETSTAGSWGGLTASPQPSYGSDALTAQSQDAVGGVQAGVGFRQLNASAEDVGTWNMDNSNTRNVAVVVAVRPASAVVINCTGASAAATTGTVTTVPKVDITSPIPAATAAVSAPGLDVSVLSVSTATASVGAATSVQIQQDRLINHVIPDATASSVAQIPAVDVTSVAVSTASVVAAVVETALDVASVPATATASVVEQVPLIDVLSVSVASASIISPVIDTGAPTVNFASVLIFGT